MELEKTFFPKTKVPLLFSTVGKHDQPRERDGAADHEEDEHRRTVSVEVFGGDGLRGVVRPASKKKGGWAPPRLAINEVLPTNLLGIPRLAGISWRGRLGAASGGSGTLGTSRRRKRWGVPSAPTLSTSKSWARGMECVSNHGCFDRLDPGL
jgi:hypothetical protein